MLAQSEAGNVFGQARAAAEAELELARARAVLEAVLTRAGITAEWNGGPEQGTALIEAVKIGLTLSACDGISRPLGAAQHSARFDGSQRCPPASRDDGR